MSGELHTTSVRGEAREPPEAGLSRALTGLPQRILKAAAAAGPSLRAVVCEVGRGPQLWTDTGKSVVLAGNFSQEDLEAAWQAMAPWSDDGVSGVDGELHFRMVLSSATGPRGIIVYLHRHRRLDLAAFVPAFKAAQEEHRPGLVVIGDPEAQERALRDICSASSLQLGVSTVLVDPQGRVGGRGRVPDKSVGGAAWVPVRDLRELPDVCEALLLHARPRVLVTALDSLADAQRLLRGAGTTMLVAAVPVRSLDPPPQELVELSTSLPLAAAVARNGKLEPLPDLRRALAKAARR